MKSIQKLNIFTLAKFQAILASIVGLLCGIIYSFGGLVIDFLVSMEMITSTETPGLSYGTFLAF